GSASLLFPGSWLGKHFQKAHYGRHRIGGFGRPFVDGQGGIGIGANVTRALAFGQFACSEFGEVSAEACLILFRQSLWNPGVSVEHAVVVESSVSLKSLASDRRHPGNNPNPIVGKAGLQEEGAVLLRLDVAIAR